ncbi:ROK family protein [Nesterenkonia sp. F]|uniref:ROK family protein n=1 Tax=Nesterenkonia sp. F TaxID=795955 RepID=UPI000255D153|nr:ROK family protein [Nesterenkonia sp. F]
MGLDVGGTKTEALALDAAGRVVARHRCVTVPGPSGVVDTVGRAVAALCGPSGEVSAESVGVGIPGQIEVPSGRVRHAVNLGLRDLDLARILERELGVPVRVENDVKAAAIGACRIRGRERESLVYLNLGTGVAAGVVVDGVLQRGVGGVAGEIGHISVDPRGETCPCGQRGCLETVAGGGAVARRWGGGDLPVLEMFDAADRGEGRAMRLRREFAAGVAAAVRLIVLTLDVPTVLLGGGLVHLGDRLRDVVVDELRRAGEASDFLHSLRIDERLEMLPPSSGAPAVGAAHLGVGMRRADVG